MSCAVFQVLLNKASEAHRNLRGELVVATDALARDDAAAEEALAAAEADSEAAAEAEEDGAGPATAAAAEAMEAAEAQASEVADRKNLVRGEAAALTAGCWASARNAWTPAVCALLSFGSTQHHTRRMLNVRVPTERFFCRLMT